MEPGDEISPAARAWGGILAFAGVLILAILTFGAFSYNVIFGVVWLLIGVPVVGVILYAANLVLFAPVALVAGGSKTRRANIAIKEPLLSAGCTLHGLVLADVDQAGSIAIHADGLVFHGRKKKGQVFEWHNIDSFGVGEEKGLFINTFDGRWALILHSVEGDDRDNWRAVLVEHGISQHSTEKIGEHAIAL